MANLRARKRNVRRLWAAAVGMIGLVWLALVAVRAAGGDPQNTGMGNPLALVEAFDRFAAKNSSATKVTLALSNLRGVSSEAMNAGGAATIDLQTGTVESSVALLPALEPFDLWLVDNRPGPGASTLAQSTDSLLKVGRYAAVSGRHSLSASLGPEAFLDFFPDRAFVVRSESTPLEAVVLTGSSNLLTRLRHRQVRLGDRAGAEAGFDPTGAARLADFTRLIVDGRRLFIQETFAGNGRTCETCHVEANNFTLDPALVETLPAGDPLFVAETNPDLAALENSDLLRRFGLFLVNADGFDPSRGFVMRGAQNVQALANSTMPQDPVFGVDFSTNGRNPNPPERLGWGNDGPALRDFALVAIAQHAPARMARVKDVDFRVPTDEELDALAAYQLSLGRQEDFDLPKLELKSTVASKGKTLFLDSGNLFEPGHKNCNGCHFNGGGTAGFTLNPAAAGFPRVDGTPLGFNIASPTNANEIPLAVTLGLPRDGGFGQIPTVFGSFGNTDDLPPPFGHFELEEFASPPVVESADTAPFFHNHAIADLESAVAFYGSAAFKASLAPKLIPIDISDDRNDPDVQAIAAFLRVLNALENIRSSIEVAERGRAMRRLADLRDLTHLALAETEDAAEVLSSGALAGNQEPGIRSARARLLAARLALRAAEHVGIPWVIDSLLKVAGQQLRAARAALAVPATLPPSFRH